MTWVKQNIIQKCLYTEVFLKKTIYGILPTGNYIIKKLSSYKKIVFWY